MDGAAVVVAIHHHPLVMPPFDLLMPEVKLTGVVHDGIGRLRRHGGMKILVDVAGQA